jgi:HAD superfamily hydrolase (TIGR01509 family)
MNTLRAVIFDSDGTLLNSFELIYSAYVHVAETHGLRVPTPEEVQAQLGNSLPDMFRSLFPGEDTNSLLETNNAYIAANVMKSEAFEGVDELLTELKAMGLKLAILTSGSAKIHSVLKHHKLSEHFTSVVHHERITKPKPSAEGFILAAKECGAKPEESIMVGDMAVDIDTGKNAGALSTIALTHGFGTKESLEEAEPGYIVDSLSAIKPIIQTYSQSL